MASQRIKGITVEIGGDTKPLVSALKEVDSQLSQTQSALRDVDKLLKVDPGNTELLTQKHKLLGQAVEETSERLKKLKEASEKAAATKDNYDAWKAKWQPIRDEIDKTSKNLNSLKNKLQEMKDAGQVDSDAYKKLQTRIAETEEKLKDLRAQQKAVNEEFGNPVSQDKFDALQREIVDTEKKLKSLEKQAKESAVAVQKIAAAGEGLKKAGQTVEKLGGALAPVSAAAAGAVTGIVKAAVDYETAFTGVKKTNEELVDSNGNVIISYDDLSDAIKDIAAKTGHSKDSIAAVMEAAGQLGVGTEYLAKFTETMVMLGDTTNLSAEEAAESIAKFANITGMSLDDADRLASVLVDLGNNFATDEASIMNMAMRIASAGTQMGLTSDEILAFAATLSSVGLEAEMGGSAFSTAMIKMHVAAETGLGPVRELTEKTGLSLRDLQLMAANNNKDFKALADSLNMTSTEMLKTVNAGVSLEQFAEVANMSIEEFVTLLEEDAPAAMTAFMMGLSDTERLGESTIQMLEDMGFSGIRIRDTMERMANGVELMVDALDRANTGWFDNVALSEEAQKKYETVAAKAGQLKETVSNLAIELGDRLLPEVDRLIDFFKKLTEDIKNMDDDTKNLIITVLEIVAVLGPALTIGGKVLEFFGGMLEVVPKLMSGISGLWGVFLAHPFGVVLAVVIIVIGVLAELYEHSQIVHDYIDEHWPNIGKVFETVSKVIEGAIGFIMDRLNDFLGLIGRAIDTVDDFFGRVRNLWTDPLGTITDGLKNQKANDNYTRALDAAAQKAADRFEHSTPKKGPLHGDDKWMIHMMDQFVDGIEQRQPALADAAEGSAGTIQSAFAPSYDWGLRAGEQAVNGIRDAFRPTRDWGRLAGEEAMYGLQNGIEKELSETEKKAKEAAEKVQTNLYQGLSKWAERQIKFESLGLGDQIAIWEGVQARLAKETDNWWTVEEKLFDLRKQLRDEEYKQLTDWAEKTVKREKLSLADQIALWQSVQEQTERQSDEWFDLQDKITELQEDALEERKKAEEDAAKEAYDAVSGYMNRLTKYEEISYQQQIQLWRAAQAEFAADSEQFAQIEETIYSLREDALQDFLSTMEDAQTDLTNIQTEYADTLKKRAGEIRDSYKIFDEVPEKEKIAGKDLVKNLQDQNKAIQTFYANLDKLAEKGVGEDLVSEIRAMGVGANDELEALLHMTRAQLLRYTNLYQERQELANSIAEKELEDLRDETETKLQETLDGVEEIWSENAPGIGELLTDLLSEGILGGMDRAVEAARTVADAVSSALAAGFELPETLFGIDETLQRIGEQSAAYNAAFSPSSPRGDRDTSRSENAQNGRSDGTESRFRGGDTFNVVIEQEIGGRRVAQDQRQYEIRESARVGRSLAPVGA